MGEQQALPEEKLIISSVHVVVEVKILRFPYP